MELDLEARSVVRQFNTGAMKVGDGRDEAETETAAWAVAARLEAIKAPQNMSTFLDRNSRSAVGYRKDRPAWAARNRELDRGFGPAVFYSVVDQVRDCVEQQIPIADNIYAIVSAEFERRAVVLGRRIEQLDDLASNLSQVKSAEFGGPMMGLDLGNPQERRKGLQNFIELGDNIAD